MTSPAVHWHEGMFLRPQHFQTAQRSWASGIATTSKWDHYYNWGLRHLKLDPDALANYRCVIRALEVRLRDGTLVVQSKNNPLPPLPLREAFERNSSLTIYLAIPHFSLGRSNAVLPEAGGDTRYLVETAELEDENTGQNPQPISLRRLNVRLLLSTQELAGHDVLPLARLKKSGRAESTPELDEDFIPPLLACDAWPLLNHGVLTAIYERIGKKMELLADLVVSRGITFESHAQGDAAIFHQLRELNQAYTTLGVLVFAQGIHPLTAYEELCRLVGQLVIFGPTHRPPDMLVYDHDDLAKCFFQIKQQIDEILDTFVEPEYRERAFIGAGMRMQVSMEPAWMEKNWQLFLAVRSPLDTADCVDLFTRAGLLDMKIGSSNRVDTLYRSGAAGLRFSHVSNPPRALPATRGLTYFQILAEAKDPEWLQVKNSLSLAIRMNENLLAGNIEGQRVLNIRHGGHSVPLQFTLYVLGKT
jgi:type VI secretion system protein ImpJ